MTFLPKIKELRKEKKATQQEIANLLGITRGAYANIENGRREPDIETLIKLADYFHVSVDYLLDRYEIPRLKFVDYNENLHPIDLSLFGDKFNTFTFQNLLSKFVALNEDGQNKVLDYTDDLVSSGKYLKTDSAPPVQSDAVG